MRYMPGILATGNGATPTATQPLQSSSQQPSPISPPTVGHLSSSTSRPPTLVAVVSVSKKKELIVLMTTPGGARVLSSPPWS